MTSMESMDSKKDVSLLKEVSLQVLRFVLMILIAVIEKIGGGYFLKKDPERYFDDVLSDTDFLTEARALNGADAQESFFTDAYGGLF